MSGALPIDAVLPALRRALAASGAVVLQAPPGAGKTTRVPVALLDADWLGGAKIVMLEPRRLAARAAARRMAQELGQDVGATVGYRVRLESKVSAATRIEVVTEGVLTRRLQSDPELAGTGLVIFDEFHERSLEADLGLALILDVQRALRPDLKLLVMSATIAPAEIAKLLGDAPVVVGECPAFAVATHHLARPMRDALDLEMIACVRRAITEESTGDILVFLPGEREIRRVAAKLVLDLAPMIDLRPLYGALSSAEQDSAIRASPPGRRKIVLATTIAETSLTIEGVRIVVDGGFKRAPRFDPRSGMSRLATLRVSRAAADQRRGRAGRLGPGICYRLWTEAEERGFAAFDAPEIANADLADLALDLAQWGAGDPADLSWLDPPPRAAYAQARALLASLEAIDDAGRITDTGRRMARLPLHPRLAHMVLAGHAARAGRTACDIAAILSERDVMVGLRDADLRTRLEIVAGARGGQARVNEAALARVRAASRQIRALIGAADATPAIDATGLIVAFAYPDRIAQRREARGHYLLASGAGAYIAETDPLACADYLAVAELDGEARDSRIFLAAPITRAEIEAHFAAAIVERQAVEWDDRAEAVIARSRRLFGAIALEDRPLVKPDAGALARAMLAGIARLGLAALPWSPAARALQARVAFVRKTFAADDWPDLADAALAATIETWLAPHLAGMTRRADLARIDLAAALGAALSWERKRRLDELAPTHLIVPSGSRIALAYESEGGSILRVRLQEVFGLKSTPKIAGGRVSVALELLSPAQRPLALTRDIASFWTNVYPQVRGEMRGRYPKHVWPEDPTTAPPTRRTKRAGVG